MGQFGHRHRTGRIVSHPALTPIPVPLALPPKRESPHEQTSHASVFQGIISILAATCPNRPVSSAYPFEGLIRLAFGATTIHRPSEVEIGTEDPDI